MPARECCFFPSAGLSFSTIRPSLGSERAFIFRIALLRCIFTVASAMPLSKAICLLKRPRATSIMIARSLGLSDSKRFLRVARAVMIAREAELNGVEEVLIWRTLLTAHLHLRTASTERYAP
jgi:hypothetical protein